ncbi:MAG: hypothetical protein P4M11_14785 [Candidatus Pacebacteria bacterium]|nr:hypothetical protein [Candidatus Paceibacterota bacterium]
MSGSVTSSNTSHTSDTSAVREFKLSLVDLKYPKAVTLLKYTLWLLIVVLVVVCTIDWAMSFAKVAENKTQFSLVSYVSARLDMISRIAFYGRTKSLIV